MGEVTLTDSAVIILFAGMLGAGDRLSLLTTSVLPLLNGLMVIPMAGVAMRIGCRKLIYIACTLAGTAYFGVVAAPFVSGYAVAALLFFITFFAFSLTGFIAGWFPLLDSFVTPERRTGFLCRMRFSHQLASVVFLTGVSMLIGPSPTVGMLQYILLAAGVIFCGRLFFIANIPEYPSLQPVSMEVGSGLKRAFRNKALRNFSTYLFLLNLAALSTVPLAIIHLKNYLSMPNDMLVMLSSASMFGMLLGYLFLPFFAKNFKSLAILTVLHFSYILVNLGIFFLKEPGECTWCLAMLLLLLHGFATAAISVLATTEMMRLATLDNKTMAMAFNGAFFYGGAGLSRVLSSLLLGSGLLAVGSLETSRMLFLIYGICLLALVPFLLTLRSR